MSKQKYYKGYRVDSIRMKGWDYSREGYYMVTICTLNMKKIFGCINNGKCELSLKGEIVDECWYDLPNHYENCVLDEFIIMPNHVHGIIQIKYPDKKEIKRTPLSEMMRAFKVFSTRKINKKDNVKGRRFWHNGYYESIIWDKQMLEIKRNYIKNNPINWNKT